MSGPPEPVEFYVALSGRALPCSSDQAARNRPLCLLILATDPVVASVRAAADSEGRTIRLSVTSHVFVRKPGTPLTTAAREVDRCNGPLTVDR